jgi:hypothetical protein
MTRVLLRTIAVVLSLCLSAEPILAAGPLTFPASASTVSSDFTRQAIPPFHGLYTRPVSRLARGFGLASALVILSLAQSITLESASRISPTWNVAQQSASRPTVVQKAPDGIELTAGEAGLPNAKDGYLSQEFVNNGKPCKLEITITPKTRVGYIVLHVQGPNQSLQSVEVFIPIRGPLFKEAIDGSVALNKHMKGVVSDNGTVTLTVELPLPLPEKAASRNVITDTYLRVRTDKPAKVTVRVAIEPDIQRDPPIQSRSTPVSMGIFASLLSGVFFLGAALGPKKRELDPHHALTQELAAFHEAQVPNALMSLLSEAIEAYQAMEKTQYSVERAQLRSRAEALKKTAMPHFVREDVHPVLLPASADQASQINRARTLLAQTMDAVLNEKAVLPAHLTELAVHYREKGIPGDLSGYLDKSVDSYVRMFKTKNSEERGIIKSALKSVELIAIQENILTTTLRGNTILTGVNLEASNAARDRLADILQAVLEGKEVPAALSRKTETPSDRKLAQRQSDEGRALGPNSPTTATDDEPRRSPDQLVNASLELIHKLDKAVQEQGRFEVFVDLQHAYDQLREEQAAYARTPVKMPEIPSPALAWRTYSDHIYSTFKLDLSVRYHLVNILQALRQIEPNRATEHALDQWMREVTRVKAAVEQAKLRDNARNKLTALTNLDTAINLAQLSLAIDNGADAATPDDLAAWHLTLRDLAAEISTFGDARAVPFSEGKWPNEKARYEQAFNRVLEKVSAISLSKSGSVPDLSPFPQKPNLQETPPVATPSEPDVTSPASPRVSTPRFSKTWLLAFAAGGVLLVMLILVWMHGRQPRTSKIGEVPSRSVTSQVAPVPDKQATAPPVPESPAPITNATPTTIVPANPEPAPVPPTTPAPVNPTPAQPAESPPPTPSPAVKAAPRLVSTYDLTKAESALVTLKHAPGKPIPTPTFYFNLKADGISVKYLEKTAIPSSEPDSQTFRITGLSGFKYERTLELVIEGLTSNPNVLDITVAVKHTPGDLNTPAPQNRPKGHSYLQHSS